MPQLTSYHITALPPSDQQENLAEVTLFLEQLSAGLEDEICTSLIEENVALAERLTIKLSRAKKLKRALSHFVSG